MKMINKCLSVISRLCKDYTKIENYDKAIADEAQTWHCHHKLETHFSDGTERPKNAQLSMEELKALDMYYNQPPELLIFLTKSEHSKLHRIGKHLTEETKKKISTNNRSRDLEIRNKISNTLKGRNLPQETCDKMSKRRKQCHWYTNGVLDTFCINCPDGFWLGMSDSHKKNISSKFKKGQVPWNKGKKKTSEEI